MWERYRRFLAEPPQIVVEWNDAPTGAKGWLVINSLRNGAAGGGTRMRAGVTREEVTYLAKTMELKFAFSGPPIGGAKSGIAFDPNDARRGEVLQRWFEAIQPYLRSCYGTGGDVNVDEQRDIVPICEALGLRHHQQGIVEGHLRPDASTLSEILTCIHEGIRQPVREPEHAVPGVAFRVSDLITGFGVVEATRSLLEKRGEGLEGQRVVIEGFGNVGAASALFFARHGARLVGLVDAEGSVVAPDGLEPAEVEDLIVRRERRLIPSHDLRRTDAERDAVYDVSADIFVPAAISGSVDRARLDQLRAAGVSTIVCGANQPFRESHLGDTTTQEYADAHFLVLADAVASQGMARAFYHLMESAPDSAAEHTFDCVSNAMAESVDALVQQLELEGASTGLMEAALKLALGA